MALPPLSKTASDANSSAIAVLQFHAHSTSGPATLSNYEFGFFSSAKIKNIISTEEAKAKLLAEQQNKKKDSETSFVPTNMAVNYVQHNRCKS